MKQFLEIEVKFNAKDIALSDFKAFCESRSPVSKLYCCGYDHFYSDHKGGTEDFVRHRIGDSFNQLTFKRKTAQKNNFIRVENNITLGKDVTVEQAAGLCDSFGFKPNFSIFKNIYVYNYDKYVLSYYAVYDLELKEMGRFIEIEMSEEWPWVSEEEAWAHLVALESEAKTLGVSPQARIKKSLFEQYRR